MRRGNGGTTKEEFRQVSGAKLNLRHWSVSVGMPGLGHDSISNWQSMSLQNWISISIEVADIDEAIEVYTNRWKLFRLVNKNGVDPVESATLELVDPKTRFRLELYKHGIIDSSGRLIPSAKHAHVSLPKSDFWSWVDQVVRMSDRVESTPWSAYVVLSDLDGHMFVIYTTESADSTMAGP